MLQHRHARRLYGGRQGSVGHALAGTGVIRTIVGNSNSSGPYDTIPGVPPAAMSWFSRIDRPTNEIKEVASVSGNTVTFTSPLTIGYGMSHTAQLTRYTLTGSQSAANSIHVTNAGVENLTLNGGADGELLFEAAAYSWAKSVEMTQWMGAGIGMDSSFRIEVRDSYLHTGSWPMPGGAGYVISFANGTSEVLVENNIMLDTCKDMVMRSLGAAALFPIITPTIHGTTTYPIWQEVAIECVAYGRPAPCSVRRKLCAEFRQRLHARQCQYLTVFRNVFTGQRREFHRHPE